RAAPYLLSIGERAEEIRRRFEERLIESQQALQELEDLVRQLREAEEERRSKMGDLSDRPYAPQAFAVEWWLRTHQVPAEEARAVAQKMEDAFAALPHWMSSRKQEGELRTALYKALLAAGISEVVAWADAILNLLRRAAE
ncbi:MAG: type I restriction endonuclease subunit R, partial [Chloroflexi bacterium]